MSDLFKVVIAFNSASDLLTVLVSEQNAEVVASCAANHSTAHGLATLDWKTGAIDGRHLVVNGRNVDYLTIEEYHLTT